MGILGSARNTLHLHSVAADTFNDGGQAGQGGNDIQFPGCGMLKTEYGKKKKEKSMY
jgi:hypothetical protein